MRLAGTTHKADMAEMERMEESRAKERQRRASWPGARIAVPLPRLPSLKARAAPRKLAWRRAPSHRWKVPRGQLYIRRNKMGEAGTILARGAGYMQLASLSLCRRRYSTVAGNGAPSTSCTRNRSVICRTTRNNKRMGRRWRTLNSLGQEREVTGLASWAASLLWTGPAVSRRPPHRPPPSFFRLFAIASPSLPSFLTLRWRAMR